MRTVHDCVVVGAGFSGVTAAKTLTEAGLDVVLLEASDTIGGRTRNRVVDGIPLEIGGQWVGGGQTEVVALAAELGVATFPTPNAGTDLVVLEGHVGPLDEDEDAHAIREAVRRIDELAAALPVASPWDAPDAEVWDSLTLHDWAEEAVGSPTGRRKLVRIVVELMTTAAADLSMLSVLQGARSSGSLSAAIGIEGGAQEQRLVGGLQHLADCLAVRAGEIRCGWPVHEVEHSSDRVVLTGPRGQVQARHVVLAIAPSMARGIAFTPPLPRERRVLHESAPMGAVIKLHAVYESPFWRDEGRSGFVMDFDGPATYIVDNTPPDASYGVLVSFLAAERARQFSPLGAGARRDAFLRQLTASLGPHAGHPKVYDDMDWTVEPWIGGGYSGVLAPGAWTTCGPVLARPTGRIHWAGSETASEWTGYVEGAIRAGRRAAEEVLAEVSARP